MTPEELEREKAFERREDARKKDQQVDENREPRPLEGFAGEDAGTTWTDQQLDSDDD
jgi:hypothetical protein